jgi:hypothetical protein
VPGADLPDTHITGKRAIVKVWCVPYDKVSKPSSCPFQQQAHRARFAIPPSCMLHNAPDQRQVHLCMCCCAANQCHQAQVRCGRDSIPWVTASGGIGSHHHRVWYGGHHNQGEDRRGSIMCSYQYSASWLGLSVSFRVDWAYCTAGRRAGQAGSARRTGNMARNTCSHRQVAGAATGTLGAVQAQASTPSHLFTSHADLPMSILLRCGSPQ